MQYRTTATVGALIRRRFRRVLKIKCEQLGIDVSMDEDWGLLDSWFTLKFTGEPDDIRELKKFLYHISRNT